MRREITLLEALIAILVAPFYVVYWIVSRTLAWIFLIGLFIVASVLMAGAFLLDLIKVDK